MINRGRAPRRESEKHKSERAERDAVVARARRRDQSECKAKALVPAVRCFGPLDPHEIIPRSAWRGGYLVLDNIVTICRAHHDWVDDNPDDAHAVGLHGYSWERTQ